MTKYRHSEQLVGTFPAVFYLIVPIMESFHVVQLEEISCRFRILLQFSQGLLNKYISEQELIWIQAMRFGIQIKYLSSNII